jgi:hypothetical protein
MARRSSSLGWLATVAVLGACSGSPTGTTDGGGGGDDDGGTLPGFDAPPPTGLFPLGVAADGATLVTGEGKPFLLHGEAAWSLIVQLNTTDAMRYLADRKARGINAVIVNLIEHYYSSSPPRNAAGAAPFTTAGDFSRPNEAYFAHADQVIDLAASQGMVVLLTPSYLGFLGGAEGWYQEMTNLSEAKCSSYGNFLGTRYASRHNIIWVWGGDYTPPSGRGGESCLKAIRDGIRAAEPAALATAHWDPETTSRDEAAFTGSIDLVGVYTYQPVLPACRAARAVTPRKPIFLFETCYEQETIQGCAATTANVRRRQWWGWLGCGAGEFVGNKSIWKFDSGIANDPRSNWIHELTSPATLHDVRMSTLAHQMAWQTLELDDALIAGSQQTGYKEIAAARTADHKQALIYIPPDIPPDGPSTVTVDLDQMNGSVTATWLDPTSERSVAVGTGLTGSKSLTTPGNNDDGDDDWVLRLSVP